MASLWAGCADRTRLRHTQLRPFVSGARRCLGEDLALLEDILALSLTTHHIRLSLVSAATVHPKPVVTLRPKEQMEMRVERRK